MCKRQIKKKTSYTQHFRSQIEFLFKKKVKLYPRQIEHFPYQINRFRLKATLDLVQLYGEPLKIKSKVVHRKGKVEFGLVKFYLVNTKLYLTWKKLNMFIPVICMA